MHAQIHNGRIDFHDILHIHFNFLSGRSHIFETPSKLVQGLWEGGDAKFRLSHWLWHWLLTLCIALPSIREMSHVVCLCLAHQWAVQKQLKRSRCRFRNQVLDGVHISHWQGHFWGGYVTAHCNIATREHCTHHGRTCLPSTHSYCEVWQDKTAMRPLATLLWTLVESVNFL